MSALARTLGGLTAAAGAVLAIRPREVAHAVGGGAPPEAWIVRALGARMVLQGGMLATYPDRRVATACSAVDGMHAASMVAAARWLPRYRRSAWLSAVVATGAAAASAFVAGRPG